MNVRNIRLRHLTSSEVRNASRAFTLVELLIVIVVIAILATLSVVAYNGITKRAVSSSLQSALQTVGTKFELYKIDNGAYPTEFSVDITVVSGVGLALTQSSSSQEFCANGTSSRFSDIQYHIDETLKISEGLCGTNIVTASIIGDYDTGTLGFIVGPKARTASSGGPFNLTVSIPEAWNQAALSWSEPSGMPVGSTYELMTRSSSTGTWYYRNPSDGSNAATTCPNTGWSCGISSATTSKTWTSTGVIPPTSSTYEYRVRYKVAGELGLYSDWATVSLTR